MPAGPLLIDLMCGWRLTPPCLFMLSSCNLLISPALAETDGSLHASSAPLEVAWAGGHTAPSKPTPFY